MYKIDNFDWMRGKEAVRMVSCDWLKVRLKSFGAGMRMKRDEERKDNERGKGKRDCSMTITDYG